jgi:hypothetical protein
LKKNKIGLDALRSIEKSNGDSYRIFAKNIKLICEKAVKFDLLKESAEKITNSLSTLSNLLETNRQFLQIGAREFSFSLYRLFTGLN